MRTTEEMWVRNLFRTAGNFLRSLLRRELGYVLIRLEGSYPERREPPFRLPFPLSLLPLFPAEPSLEELREVLEALAQDRRVEGVVVRVGRLSAGPATVQALRGMIERLREQGKRVLCWLPEADTWTTYLASACDQVVLPQSGALFAAGLLAEAVFLKDALALIGVEADFEALREYKVSPDTFRRSSMSGPHREMLEAILDSLFDEVVTQIAEGRGLQPEQVRALIDRMPLSARESVEVGLADEVAYEDELVQRVGAERLLPWGEARRWLRRPVRWRRRPAIGVVSVEGMIVAGPSRRIPPLPVPLPFVEQLAGSETVVQALRAAERDRRIGAVVLYVDSPGGSALASDLIWQEVRRLRERKPVVALMGNRATSGGYYVAVAANRIIAQPATLTGSIGIWGGKFVTAGLYERLKVGREVLQRGAHASLYADHLPFSEEERQVIRAQLEESYGRFKARVAEGRGMDPERVEELARGRVWTGQQALERGLVDGLGGFEAALGEARRLLGLEPDVWLPVVTVEPPRPFQLPMPPHAPEKERLTAMAALARERVWALPPWTVRIRG